MDGFWQITLIILIGGLICGCLYNREDKSIIKKSILFIGLFHYAISTFRMLQGHGAEMLGYAFVGKGISGYVKVIALVIAITLVVFLVSYLYKGSVVIFEKSVAVYCFLQIMICMCYGLPSLTVTFVAGIVAAIVGIVWNLISKDSISLEVDKKCIILWLASVICWTIVFVINGPTEIYAYNGSAFPFGYKDFIYYLIIFGIAIVIGSLCACRFLWSNKQTICASIVVLSYTVMSYIQTMFLNGQLEDMQGGTQTWSTTKVAINACIWIMAVIAIALIVCKCYKSDLKIVCTIALVVAILQLLSFFSLVVGRTLSSSDSKNLVTDNMYSIAKDENIIVFILDTYDSQMVKYVEKQFPDYYDELHDFSFYSNMKSHFDYTDGSLPYLMTGILVDEYSSKEYEQSEFINTISGYGYNINAYTDAKYVEHLDEGRINNYTKEWYTNLVFEKTVNQMIDCVRYRALPFAVKKYYSYSDFNLVDCIYDSNVYFFGTDAEIYHKLNETGLKISDANGSAMNIYHLYGAHMPYYLKEDMTYDYVNQDPLAQWKASMKVVYQYMDKLKEIDAYENSTIIIMADHGPGARQRGPLQELGVELSDDLHPIFFIKRPGEHHDKYVENDIETSHDDFFGTIIKSINENDASYGDAIWERN